MKKTSWILIGTVSCCLAILSVAWLQEKEVKKEEVQPKYVGVSECQACHATKAIGNQYGIWAKSKHANAYAALATKRAKKVAEKAGVPKEMWDKLQQCQMCLKCHSTAFGVDTLLIAKTFKIKDGIQCELCHGPGSEYKMVMKDKEAAIKAGLKYPDKEFCMMCHKEKPSHAVLKLKKFDYEKAIKMIAHKRPPKKEEKCR